RQRYLQCLVVRGLRRDCRKRRLQCLEPAPTLEAFVLRKPREIVVGGDHRQVLPDNRAGGGKRHGLPYPFGKRGLPLYRQRVGAPEMLDVAIVKWLVEALPQRQQPAIQDGVEDPESEERKPHAFMVSCLAHMLSALSRRRGGDRRCGW